MLPADMLDEVCETCKRPRYTDKDFDRWNLEVGAGFTGPEPDWARAICWTTRGYKCRCKTGLAPVSPST